MVTFTFSSFLLANYYCFFRQDGSSPKKFLMLFGFLMPCIVITCCYSAIFIKVKQSRRNVQQHMKYALMT